jgi:outer membrane cobalamin receptor
MGSNRCRKRGDYGAITRIVLIGLIVLHPAGVSAEAETTRHLTLDEIIVTDEATGDPMGTAVGIKTIEKGRNITIPDVLKSEPDIDVKRRTLVGDTADSLSIRGFSGNRIMLNILSRYGLFSTHRRCIGQPEAV